MKHKGPSALRQMIQDGVSLSTAFNAVRSRVGHNASERLKTGQSAVGEAKGGQVSTVGLRPYTLEEKLKHLLQMVAKGTVAFGNRISLETIRHELKKPENDGLGIHQMVDVLKQKNLLKLVQKPMAAFKLKAPAPGF